MLRSSLFESLPELSAPVLTVYLNTSREKAANRAIEPGYLINLGSQAKLAEERIDPQSRGAFRKQVERAEGYLRIHPPASKGVAVFAGEHCWHFVPLEATVDDEVYWGAPNVAPLLWLLEEQKPCGVVRVDAKRAQFFVYGLGEMLALEDIECLTAPTKEKEMGPVARAHGVHVSRGTNRDVFERHRDTQSSHYYRQIAHRMARWWEAEHLQAFFLLGLREVIQAIQAETDANLREKIVPIEEDLGWASTAELRERIEPFVVQRQRQRETAVVDKLFSEEPGAVVGIDETLVLLQQGKLRALVVFKGLDADLKRCSECLWTDRTADPKCPACGRERFAVTLHDVLPELVRRHKVSMEVVSGEAGQKLQKAGGMGAWLRELERKEYGQGLRFA